MASSTVSATRIWRPYFVLQSQGFAIEKVATARNVIEFSGSAGQIRRAFHTSIHSYVVRGEQPMQMRVIRRFPQRWRQSLLALPA